MEDVWWKKAKKVIKKMKLDYIEHISTIFFDTLLGLVIDRDRIKWIEIYIRSEIYLREYWLSSKYKYIIDESKLKSEMFKYKEFLDAGKLNNYEDLNIEQLFNI